MMNYKIINDEEKFKDFIEWLPPLGKEEKYYVALFARGKYSKGFSSSKSDSQQIARFLVDRDKLFNRVKQLECEVGSFEKNGLSVPQDALALYINPSPRSLRKTVRKLINSCVEYLAGEREFLNPTQEALTCAHRSKGKNQIVAFDFDVDVSEVEPLVSGLKQAVNIEALTLTRTRGGIHAFVNPKLVAKEFEKSWYKSLAALGADRTGDFETPAWGTAQGGFTPYKIEL